MLDLKVSLSISDSVHNLKIILLIPICFRFNGVRNNNGYISSSGDGGSTSSSRCPTKGSCTQGLRIPSELGPRSNLSCLL